MVNSNIVFTKVNIKVDDVVHFDVEYYWNVDGENVNISMRYEDGRMESFSYSPARTLFDDESVLEHVRKCAVDDYNSRESAAD